MRHRCPVAYSDYLGWSLFRHEDVALALDDYHAFSSAVSSHLSVPSGMDPPRHTVYRRSVERYFEPERVEAFEPLCRNISADLVSGLERGAEIDLVTRLARLFAVRVQCAFLGGPDNLHEPLLQWVRKNHEATLTRNVRAIAAIEAEFGGYIREVLEARLQAGADAPADITTDLLRERIHNRPLNYQELVGVQRNWAVGESETVTACVDILVHYLARYLPIPWQIRDLLPAAIDEIVRLHALLIRPPEVGGRQIGALMWASANHDETVVRNPEESRLHRDSKQNSLRARHPCLSPRATGGAGTARRDGGITLEITREGAGARSPPYIRGLSGRQLFGPAAALEIVFSDGGLCPKGPALHFRPAQRRRLGGPDLTDYHAERSAPRKVRLSA
jgi:cytochrome P450